MSENVRVVVDDRLQRTIAAMESSLRRMEVQAKDRAVADQFRVLEKVANQTTREFQQLLEAFSVGAVIGTGTLVGALYAVNQALQSFSSSQADFGHSVEELGLSRAEFLHIQFALRTQGYTLEQASSLIKKYATNLQDLASENSEIRTRLGAQGGWSGWALAEKLTKSVEAGDIAGAMREGWKLQAGMTREGAEVFAEIFGMPLRVMQTPEIMSQLVMPRVFLADNSKAVEDFLKSMVQSQVNMRGMQIALANAALPAMNMLLNTFQKEGGVATRILDRLPKIAEGISKAMMKIKPEVIIDAVMAVGNLIGTVGGLFIGTIKPTIDAFTALIKWWTDVATATGIVAKLLQGPSAWGKLTPAERESLKEFLWGKPSTSGMDRSLAARLGLSPDAANDAYLKRQYGIGDPKPAQPFLWSDYARFKTPGAEPEEESRSRLLWERQLYPVPKYGAGLMAADASSSIVRAVLARVATKDLPAFLHGGLIGVATERGHDVPQWMRAPGEFMQRGDTRQALGLLSVLGGTSRSAHVAERLAGATDIAAEATKPDRLRFVTDILRRFYRPTIVKSEPSGEEAARDTWEAIKRAYIPDLATRRGGDFTGGGGTSRGAGASGDWGGGTSAAPAQQAPGPTSGGGGGAPSAPAQQAPAPAASFNERFGDWGGGGTSAAPAQQAPGPSGGASGSWGDGGGGTAQAAPAQQAPGPAATLGERFGAWKGEGGATAPDVAPAPAPAPPATFGERFGEWGGEQTPMPSPRPAGAPTALMPSEEWSSSRLKVDPRPGLPLPPIDETYNPAFFTKTRRGDILSGSRYDLGPIQKRGHTPGHPGPGIPMPEPRTGGDTVLDSELNIQRRIDEAVGLPDMPGALPDELKGQQKWEPTAEEAISAAFQEGGPAAAKPIIVGEYGPEAIIPDRSSYVLSTKDLAAFWRGGLLEAAAQRGYDIPQWLRAPGKFQQREDVQQALAMMGYLSAPGGVSRTAKIAESVADYATAAANPETWKRWRSVYRVVMDRFMAEEIQPVAASNLHIRVRADRDTKVTHQTDAFDAVTTQRDYRQQRLSMM